MHRVSSAVRAHLIWLMAAGIFGLLVAAAGCGGGSTGSSQGGERTPVTYALGFTPNYAQAYFFAALDKGYYRDRGLEVDYVVPESTATSTKLVGTGKTQIGEVVGIDPIPAVARGLPVTVVNTFSPATDLGLMALPENVSSIEDIKGHKVAVVGASPYNTVCRSRFLEANGMSEDDIDAVDVGFTLVPPLLTEKVIAAEAGEEAEVVIAENERGGKPVDFYSYTGVCPPLPIEQIANRSFLEENPEAARAFVAATLEGVKFATEHPKEAREIFIKRFPEAKDPIEYYEVIIPTFCGREHDEKGLGYYDAEPWKQLIDVAVDGGVVEQAPELSEVVTDDYLPETTIKSSACG